MKIGGGLNYAVGPMGAGKSFYGVRKIIDHLGTGGYVVTNIELLPGWADRVARQLARTSTPSRRQRIAAKLEARYVYEADLVEAMRYRLPGHGEGRGLFMWDEGHNDLNNRRWREEERGAILEWATQLRKLGFVGYLLSQSIENTDAQLRRSCNFVIRLQNQREQMRVLGLRVTPWPLFLASWYSAHVPISTQRGGKTAPVRVERYFLSWHRKLYDSWGLYHGLAAGDDRRDVIMLPENPLDRLALAAAPAVFASPSERGFQTPEWSEAPDHAETG